MLLLPGLLLPRDGAVDNPLGQVDRHAGVAGSLNLRIPSSRWIPLLAAHPAHVRPDSVQTGWMSTRRIELGIPSRHERPLPRSVLVAEALPPHYSSTIMRLPPVWLAREAPREWNLNGRPAVYHSLEVSGAGNRRTHAGHNAETLTRARE